MAATLSELQFGLALTNRYTSASFTMAPLDTANLPPNTANRINYRLFINNIDTNQLVSTKMSVLYSSFATASASNTGTPLPITLNFADCLPGPQTYLSSTL